MFLFKVQMVLECINVVECSTYGVVFQHLCMFVCLRLVVHVHSVCSCKGCVIMCLYV